MRVVPRPRLETENERYYVDLLLIVVWTTGDLTSSTRVSSASGTYMP